VKVLDVKGLDVKVLPRQRRPMGSGRRKGQPSALGADQDCSFPSAPPSDPRSSGPRILIRPPSSDCDASTATIRPGNGSCMWVRYCSRRQREILLCTTLVATRLLWSTAASNYLFTQSTKNEKHRCMRRAPAWNSDAAKSLVSSSCEILLRVSGSCPAATMRWRMTGWRGCS